MNVCSALASAALDGFFVKRPEICHEMTIHSVSLSMLQPHA